ncbi:MAG: redox-regulated ATPase YchF, partial [Betaproteobacteria bacterium]|nr:redox-regulated ATPase YchF [Betaproteobacteria bacterium]
MALQCGIVGLPNVGKSTLFNALTKAGIAAENYPFCTIEPNVGIVEVPDERLQALASIAKPERVLPATVEFVDIAGLVAGASKGEGLGNQFLANIRETDAVVHVVRCFEDSNVVHVSGRVDPLSDIEIINTELALADMATVDKALTRYAKVARSGGDKEAMRLVQVLDKCLPALNQARPVRSIELDEEEVALLRPLCLITAKPTMYIANVRDDGFKNNPHLDRVSLMAQSEGATVVPICAAIEAEIADMSQSRSYEEVAESLVRLKASDERMKAAGRPITSRKAYFIGILSNVDAGASVAEISDEDLEKEVREQEAADQDDRVAVGTQRRKAAGQATIVGRGGLRRQHHV